MPPTLASSIGRRPRRSAAEAVGEEERGHDGRRLGGAEEDRGAEHRAVGSDADVAEHPRRIQDHRRNAARLLEHLQAEDGNHHAPHFRRGAEQELAPHARRHRRRAGGGPGALGRRLPDGSGPVGSDVGEGRGTVVFPRAQATPVVRRVVARRPKW